MKQRITILLIVIVAAVVSAGNPAYSDDGACAPPPDALSIEDALDAWGAYRDCLETEVNAAKDVGEAVRLQQEATQAERRQEELRRKSTCPRPADSLSLEDALDAWGTYEDCLKNITSTTTLTSPAAAACTEAPTISHQSGGVPQVGSCVCRTRCLAASVVLTTCCFLAV